LPRLGLTHHRVVEQAAEVADEAGLDRLTLAAVAKRLGISLPGLYKHIDSLDSLKRDLAVLGVQELTAAMSAAAVGLPQSVDDTFTRLIDSLDATFTRWAGQPEPL
jgi:AcrR family transcriptional regulator